MKRDGFVKADLVHVASHVHAIERDRSILSVPTSRICSSKRERFVNAIALEFLSFFRRPVDFRIWKVPLPSRVVTLSPVDVTTATFIVTNMNTAAQRTHQEASTATLPIGELKLYGQLIGRKIFCLSIG